MAFVCLRSSEACAGSLGHGSPGTRNPSIGRKRCEVYVHGDSNQPLILTAATGPFIQFPRTSRAKPPHPFPPFSCNIIIELRIFLFLREMVDLSRTIFALTLGNTPNRTWRFFRLPWLWCAYYGLGGSISLVNKMTRSMGNRPSS